MGLGKNAMEEYGIGLLGQEITMVGAGLTSTGEEAEDTYNYVDNLYLQTAIRYGWIFEVLWLLLCTKAVYTAYKKNDILLFIIVCMLALHGLLDDLLLYPYYNSFCYFLYTGGWICGAKRKRLRNCQVESQKSKVEDQANEME